MFKLSYRSITPKIVFGFFPYFILLILPTLGIMRNPDPLHDGYFYAMARGLNAGLIMHEDIYNHYGPLVPWLISIQMKLTGESLASVRILGAVTAGIISILVFHKAKFILGTKSALSIVLLWQFLDGSRSQIDSPRWVWGAPLWPTNIAILLTLILLIFANRIIMQPTVIQSRKMLIPSLMAGGLGALLPYSRIQGFVSYCALITFIIFATRQSRNWPTLKFFVAGSIAVHTIFLMFVIKPKAVNDFLYQQFISPFTLVDSVMRNRWQGWLLSIVISIVIGIIGIVLLITLYNALKKTFSSVPLVVALAVVIFISYYFSARFEFPTRFDGDLRLWTIKGFSMIPAWFVWAWFLVGAFFLLAQLLKSLLGNESVSKRGLINGNSLVFISLIPHLFWNYSYIYLLLPILLIMVLDNSTTAFKNLLTSTLVQSLVRGATIAFILVFSLGLSLKQERFESWELREFSRNSAYASSVDSEVKRIEDFMEEGASSQFYCENQFFRVWDLNSYLIDKKLYIDRPMDFESYLSRVDKANIILYCEPDDKSLAKIRNLSEESDWKLIYEPVVDSRFNIFILKRK